MRNAQILLLTGLLFATAQAAEVEIRLVPFNQPDIEVNIPVGNKTAMDAQYLYTLTEGERHSFHGPLSAWARNIRLNGQPTFEIYLNGKYIDRVPRARRTLAPGKHTLTPGNHVLVVNPDGTVTSEDPDYSISTEPRSAWLPGKSVVDGAIAANNTKSLAEPNTRAKPSVTFNKGAKVEVLKTENGWSEIKLPPRYICKLKCYPFHLRAVRHEELNMEKVPVRPGLEQIPLPNIAIRLGDDKGNEPLELLPQGGGRFLNLTLWLPTNTNGVGYLVHPLKQTFHLTSKGLISGEGEGGYKEDTWKNFGHEMRIPVNRIAASGDPESSIHIREMQMIGFSADEPEKFANLYAREAPFEFRVSELGPGLLIDGDLSKLPNKFLRVDWTDATKLRQKGLVAETQTKHLRAGQSVTARVRALDPTSGSLTIEAMRSVTNQLHQLSLQIKTATQQVAATRTRLYNGDPMIKTAAAASAQARTKVTQLTAQHAAELKKQVTAQTAVDTALANVKKAEADLAAKKKKPDTPAAIQAAETKVTQAKAAHTTQVTAFNMQKAKVDDFAKQITTAKAAVTTADTKLSQIITAVLKTSKTVPALHKAFTASEVTLKNLKAANAAAEMDLAAKKEIVTQRGHINPLANMKIFAAIKPHYSSEWQKLEVTPSGQNEVTFTVPADKKPGVYQLRLGVLPLLGRDAPFFGDQWVTIAGEQKAGVGAFTRRGRTAFLRGEPFWLAIAATAAAGETLQSAPVTASLVDANGRKFRILQSEVKADDGARRTFIVSLDGATTLNLAPGKYQVECSLGTQTGPPLQIEIIDPEPKTHFKNLLLGKYNNLGFDYAGFNSTGDAVGSRDLWNYNLHKASSLKADSLVREMVENGYNAFKGMDYGMNRVSFPQSMRIRGLVRDRAALGPWEAFAPPSARDRFLDAAVRYRLEFYENLFTQHDSMMPRGEKFLQACERYSTLETASMMHSPAFKGVCLYDELTQSLDHDTSGVVLKFFRDAENQLFRQRAGYSSAEAIKALDTFTGLPEGRRDYALLEKYRAWPRHLDWQWAEFSRRMGGAAKIVMPSARNFTLHHVNALPGMNLSTGDGTIHTKFEALDMISAVGYKDMGGWGSMPVSGPMMGDAMRVRDDITVMPMIYGLGTGMWGDSNVRDAFLTLSQNVDGLSFFQFESSPKTPKGSDNHSGVKDIAARLTTPYGDFLLAAKRGYKKIAIYNSFDADTLSPRKPIIPAYLCEGLWVACLRAGYPADFLTDEQILADKGAEYEVIFAPGWYFQEEVPPAIKAALQRLLDGGKILVVERASKLPNVLPGVNRLDSDLDEIADRLGGSFPKHLDFDNERWWQFTVKTRDEVTAFLKKHKIEPAVEHDMLVGPDWLSCRQAQYLVLANHAYVGFRGNHKTLYQAPSRPVLRFPKRPPVCYDMLEMKPVPVKTLPDGRMELTADLMHVPGKIYAFLPASIAKLDLRAKGPETGGAALVFEVSALDATGKTIDAGIPLEYRLTDAKGNELRHVYRVAAPTYRGVYHVPVNVPNGGVTLYVRELISGTEATVKFSVQPGDFALPKSASPDLRVMQTDHIKQFLKDGSQKAQRLLRVEDFKDIRLLALKIRRKDGLRNTFHGNALPDNLAPYIFNHPGFTDARKLLVDYDPQKPFEENIQKAFVDGLNAVIQESRLFNDERFPPGILSVRADALGKEVKDDYVDVNRLLLEEYYHGEIYERPVIYIGLEDESLRPAAKKLSDHFISRGLRVRATSMQAWVNGPGVGWSEGDKELPPLSGMRLWRGEIIKPGVFVHGPLILLGHNQGLVEKMADRDLFPEPVSENFPGTGRCVIGWVRQAFHTQHDTIYLLGDTSGVSKGVDALLAGSLQDTVQPRSSLTKPKTPAAVELTAFPSGKKNPDAYSSRFSTRDHVRKIAIDDNTKRIAVATMGFGQNLFCLDGNGKKLWSQFLPEHNVYHVEWIDDGKKILAATGHGFFLFIVDGATGKVLKKFASTEWPQMHVDREHNTEVEIIQNPQLRQFIVLGATGLIAVDYDGNLLWKYERIKDIVYYPEEMTQTSRAGFGSYLKPIAVAISPDGTQLAYNETTVIGSTMGFGGIISLWQNQPQIIDAKTGKILLLDKTSDPASSDEWQVTWPEGSEAPWIHANNLSAPLEFDPAVTTTPNPGKLGNFVAPITRELKSGGGTLNRDFHMVERRTAAGERKWLYTNRSDVWLRERDLFNATDTRLWRSGRAGKIICIDLNNRNLIWEHDKISEGAVLAVTGDELAAGTRNGVVSLFDADGNVKWSTNLGELHTLPEGDYREYLAKALARDIDSTGPGKFFPVIEAGENDFNGILKFGIDVVRNGNFASSNIWAGNKPFQIVPNAYLGAGALRMKDQLVTQKIEAKAVTSATYLLEFWYRPVDADSLLAAGAVLHGEGDNPHFTGSNYKGRPGEWTFGRLAVKTMADTKKLEVGFEAGGGVDVAKVSFRVVRFPSANLLANQELHKIEPTHPKDQRVRYARIPQSLRDRMIGQNNVAVMMQTTPLNEVVFTQEQAFLQNGRLDDLHEMWCFRPNPMGFSVTLAQPSYVSHVVIYMNNTKPNLNYRAISVLANDMEKKVPRTVGLVRGDKRRFVVIQLKEPVFTDSVKLMPGHSGGRQDGITEIEVYGPIGGRDQLAAAGFAEDPHAMPMFMGTPAHVPSLPEDLVGGYSEDTKLANHQQGERAPALNAGGTAVNGVFALPMASGDTRIQGENKNRNPIILARPINEDVKKTMDAEATEARRVKRTPFLGWQSSTVTPISTPARYAGRLIVGSSDYKMHAVADNGAHLWAFATGGRVYSSPTPEGRDVYFGSDDGVLYKTDVDSGILIWEFKTGGRIRSAPAVVGGRVYFASWDGFVYALDARLGRLLWKSPIAKNTSSSPAVFNNRIYIGDENGQLRCLNAADGKQVWIRELAGQRVSACPVVTPDGVFFQGEEGMAMMLNHSGGVLWQKDTFTHMRVVGQPPPLLTGQPMPTKTQLFITTTRGLSVIVRATGERDPRFSGGPPAGRNLTSAIIYDDRLCVVEDFTEVQGGLDNYIVRHGVKLSVYRNPAKKTAAK